MQINKINKKTQSLFELLRSKKILAILDGDGSFGEINPNDGSEVVSISMPYLSGPAICDISNTFGFPVIYNSVSRWSYLDDLIKNCIDNNKISELLSYLFSKKQFVDKLKGKKPETIDKIHKQIIEEILQQINGILYFSENELVIVNNKFYIKKLGESISIEAPSVKNIDRAYIKDLSDRAMKDISDNNYDSAITKSKTLLEEVFCYVIEKKDEKPSDSGDIGKLYNQVKTLYNMHQHKDNDKRINILLSGLEKIVSSISQMRNSGGSDAHGLGSKRIKVYEYHTRLIVNSAMTMADFILSVYENKENSK